MKAPTGVIHGRFQPFHNGHLEYALAAKERCEFLLVGITNPHAEMMAFDAADPNRDSREANPLTFYERMMLIRAALLEASISPEAFAIVPLPINRPEYIADYAPRHARYFVTIYDAWGERKLQILHDLRLDVQVLWKRPAEQKEYVGSDLRQLIRANAPWEHLVPNAVVKTIRNLDLIEKIASQ